MKKSEIKTKLIRTIADAYCLNNLFSFEDEFKKGLEDELNSLLSFDTTVNILYLGKYTRVEIGFEEYGKNYVVHAKIETEHITSY